MSVTTTSPASSKDEENKETFVNRRTYFFYEGQHGDPRCLSTYGIQYKKPDVDMMMQAVIALAEQLAREEKGQE